MAIPNYLIPFPQGYSPIPRPVPSSVMARALAASVAETITPPAGAKYVVFGFTSNTYVNCYTTATVPGDTTDGTASELNPSGYALPPEVTAISVLSPVAGAIVTASFYV